MTAAVIGSIIQDKRKPTSLPARCKITTHRRSSAALATSQTLKRKKRGRARKTKEIATADTDEKSKREKKSTEEVERAIKVPSSKCLKHKEEDKTEEKLSSKLSDVKVSPPSGDSRALPKRKPGRPKKNESVAKTADEQSEASASKEIFDAKLTCNNSDYLGGAMMGGATSAFSTLNSIPTGDTLSSNVLSREQNESCASDKTSSIGGSFLNLKSPAQASKPPPERVFPDSLPVASKSDRLLPDLIKVLPQSDKLLPVKPLPLPQNQSTNLLSSLILPRPKSKGHKSSLSFSKLGYQFKVNPFRPQDARKQEKKQKKHRHHRRHRSISSSHPCYKTGKKHSSLLGKRIGYTQSSLLLSNYDLESLIKAFKQLCFGPARNGASGLRNGASTMRNSASLAVSSLMGAGAAGLVQRSGDLPAASALKTK